MTAWLGSTLDEHVRRGGSRGSVALDPDDALPLSQSMLLDVAG